ncbi:hypothetical protein HanRHA438_Chr16g0788391 [Helianthus annuus]|nr:hypothetical protein HanRHA438_Chr16g0788391 [Helianthus annuus]
MADFEGGPQVRSPQGHWRIYWGSEGSISPLVGQSYCIPEYSIGTVFTVLTPRLSLTEHLKLKREVVLFFRRL